MTAGSGWLFGVTIFAGAFLLFASEPLVAKEILPWFGGAAAVWSVCLLFFQTALLLGYAYAHRLRSRVPPRAQAMVHATIVAVSLAALPIIPNAMWKPTAAQDPAWRILLVLGATVGLPFFVLASLGPLLQAWYFERDASGRPYRLYALSNAGSLGALVAYPALIEPRLALRAQAWGWSLAYGVVAATSVVVAFSHPVRQKTADKGGAPEASFGRRLLWIALAAVPSALLLAVTNHISQNVASAPFLWVLPLGIYLLSFILCFEGRRWYVRGLWLRLLGVALGGMAYGISEDLETAALKVLLPLFCAGLFVCCMVCHGELARLKPEPSQLTQFYLLLSLGGALGGLFVALIAPYWFRNLWELPLALGGCGVLVLVVLWSDPESYFFHKRFHPAWLGMVALVIALCVNLGMTSRRLSRDTRVMVRNFYGLLRVKERVRPLIVSMETDPKNLFDAPDLRIRELVNGVISHGEQFQESSLRRQPTTYYSRESGVGFAIDIAERHGAVRVGVIGLGAGTLAAYGRPTDVFRFYDINPLVVTLARNEFTYLRDSPAQNDVVQGDARLSLERESSQQFDVLAVDAFTGDSIPVHLLTRETFELYRRHLKPGGVLAMHISNRYLDLEPVVAAAAAAIGEQAMVVSNGPDESRSISTSTWVLVAAKDSKLAEEVWHDSGATPATQNRVLWTDDYSSLVRVLK